MPTKAYKLQSPANVRKEEQIRALLSPWRRALIDATHYAYRNFTLQGIRVPKRFSLKTMNLDTVLSARQVNSVWVQTQGALTSWESQVQERFTFYVTRSTLDEFTKITLYRLNQYKAWFHTNPHLPMWVTQDGELTHTKSQNSFGEWGVPGDILRLARHIARKAISDRPLPDLSHVNVMLLDGTVANLESSRNTQDLWLRVATLTRGKPVLIPLKLNKYAASKPGSYNNGAQIIIKNNRVYYTLTKTTPDAEPRAEGSEIGVDWGVTNMFTDSRGNQYGQVLYAWLKDRDMELLALTKALQANGVRLTDSKRYRAFNQRIREYVKNETGRILNGLAHEDIRLLAVESLDFRHGGLSSRMNRILTRAGRGAVKSKLKDLTVTYGITVHTVNPAYTSQECNKCGCVDKKNRPSQKIFQCVNCAWFSHADVNAARNILRRSQNGEAWLFVKRDVIRERLLVRYQKLNSGTPSTVRLDGVFAPS